MKCLRIYSTPDGESYFGKVDSNDGNATIPQSSAFRAFGLLPSVTRPLCPYPRRYARSGLSYTAGYASCHMVGWQRGI